MPQRPALAPGSAEIYGASADRAIEETTHAAAEKERSSQADPEESSDGDCALQHAGGREGWFTPADSVAQKLRAGVNHPSRPKHSETIDASLPVACVSALHWPLLRH